MDAAMLSTCPVVIGQLRDAEHCAILAAMRINANVFCNFRTLATSCKKQTPWRRRGMDFVTIYFTITHNTGNRTPTKQGRILPSGKSYPRFVVKRVKKIQFYPLWSGKVAKKKLG